MSVEMPGKDRKRFTCDHVASNHTQPQDQGPGNSLTGYLHRNRLQAPQGHVPHLKLTICLPPSKPGSAVWVLGHSERCHQNPWRHTCSSVSLPPGAPGVGAPRERQRQDRAEMHVSCGVDPETALRSPRGTAPVATSVRPWMWGSHPARKGLGKVVRSGWQPCPPGNRSFLKRTCPHPSMSITTQWKSFPSASEVFLDSICSASSFQTLQRPLVSSSHSGKPLSTLQSE